MKQTDGEKKQTIRLFVNDKLHEHARSFKILEGGIVAVTCQNGGSGETWMEFYSPMADWFIDTLVG